MGDSSHLRHAVTLLILSALSFLRGWLMGTGIGLCGAAQEIQPVFTRNAFSSDVQAVE